jgi:hypothetical protein
VVTQTLAYCLSLRKARGGLKDKLSWKLGDTGVMNQLIQSPKTELPLELYLILSPFLVERSKVYARDDI